jgi:adenylate kinase family enzyme
VAVVGNSGSGKSTLARRLATVLDVPFVELDLIFHLPGWQELPPEDFRAAVTERVGADAWVVDGNYNTVRELVWQHADTVVWLDLPRSVVMRQIITRTLRRVITGEQLWNGNREPFGNLWRLDPTKSIIRWAWTQHQKYGDRYSSAMTDPAWQHLRFVRLQSHREAEAMLASLTSP